MPIHSLLAAAVTVVQGVPTAPMPSKMLLDFQPGAVACDGGVPQAIALAKPVPAAGSISSGQSIAPYRFAFRIDAAGRVVGIRPEPRSMPGLYVATPDLQPALAASRFAVGAPLEGCTIRYDVDVVPVASAAMDVVRRYLTLPHDAAWFESDIRARGRDTDGDCYTGQAPIPLLRAFPDRDAIPQAAGTMAMTVTGFDVDRSGRPVRIRTIQSDGNATLDAAVRAAVARSRFKPGAARTGCFLPYFRRQPIPLPAPEAAPLDTYRSDGRGCPAEDVKWAHLPTLTFPEPFRRRGVEGWAAVRYDVAPWGQTGNVTVVASEPAAVFGDQAKQIIGSARRSASAQGATGCVERVRFKLPSDMEGGSYTPAPPPPPPINF